MSDRAAGALVQHLSKLARAVSDRDKSDAQLLKRFVAERDETAFADLLKRHGGLVWAVCRRLSRHREDAEDAFRATFLILLRKAAAIRKGTALASWLYGVAYRVATRANENAVRRSLAEGRISLRNVEQPVKTQIARIITAANLR